MKGEKVFYQDRYNLIDFRNVLQVQRTYDEDGERLGYLQISLKRRSFLDDRPNVCILWEPESLKFLKAYKKWLNKDN